MEKKIIITFLIVAAIVALSIFFLYEPETNEEDKREGKITDETDAEETGSQTETPGIDGGTGGSGTGGTGGNGGNGNDGTSSEENKTVPPNIYAAPCGTYFREYGICAGACPLGSCVQEGRSCYCKI